MSEEVNKEQTKDAEQEKITELSDAQLDEAAGGGPQAGGSAGATLAGNDHGNDDGNVAGMKIAPSQTQVIIMG